MMRCVVGALLLVALCQPSTAFVPAFTPRVLPSVGRVELCHGAVSFPRFRSRTCGLSRGLRMAQTEIEYKLEKKEELEGGGNKYDVTVNVDPKMVKDAYGAIMKDFRKVAQFPGFRKGTIPPFMLPKCKEFAILRCLEKSLTLVAEQEKLKVANPARKPVLDEEQTKSLVSNFKETQGFTYTISAELAPNPDGEDAGLSDLLVREE